MTSITALILVWKIYWLKKDATSREIPNYIVKCGNLARCEASQWSKMTIYVTRSVRATPLRSTTLILNHDAQYIKGVPVLIHSSNSDLLSKSRLHELLNLPIVTKLRLNMRLSVSTSKSLTFLHAIFKYQGYQFILSYRDASGPGKRSSAANFRGNASSPKDNYRLRIRGFDRRLHWVAFQLSLLRHSPSR